MIKEVLLNHRGGNYIYRVNCDKLDKLCNGHFVSLKTYLNFIVKNCPNPFFNNGPRSSLLKFKLLNDVMEVAGHEVSTLARYGLEINKDRFSDAHSKVQVFMLEHDKNTLAMEVPIWLMPNELAGYKKFFNDEEILTGHIDILRVKDEKIWIWDYKPDAKKEKYASTQIFFYAYMLSKRTGINLDKIRCGYFDRNFTFVFKPLESYLYKLNEQKNLITK